MKAPDILYVTVGERTEMLSTRRHDYDVAYIRKDAVLDLIKEQKQIAMGFSYEHLKMLENKINSL